MDRSRYRTVRIPKRSGVGVRILEIPDDELMVRQRSILRWLCARRLAASPFAHGFIRRRSIATNAAPHVGKAVVIRLDIKDFFPSVSAVMIRRVLAEAQIPPVDARAITESCTLDGRLPQGAPTSPFLSNLVATRLDYRLAGLARNWRGGTFKVAFTRYADDLCFSSADRRLCRIIPAATRIIEDSGFRLNREKIRVYRRGVRQIVAGAVVNQKVNVPRPVRRNLRATLHQARRAIMNGTRQGIDVARMRGLASHIHSVNPKAGAFFLREVDEIERLLVVSSQQT